MTTIDTKWSLSHHPRYYNPPGRKYPRRPPPPPAHKPRNNKQTHPNEGEYDEGKGLEPLSVSSPPYIASSEPHVFDEKTFNNDYSKSFVGRFKEPSYYNKGLFEKPSKNSPKYDVFTDVFTDVPERITYDPDPSIGQIEEEKHLPYHSSHDDHPLTNTSSSFYHLIPLSIERYKRIENLRYNEDKSHLDNYFYESNRNLESLLTEFDKKNMKCKGVTSINCYTIRKNILKIKSEIKKLNTQYTSLSTGDTLNEAKGIVKKLLLYELNLNCYVSFVYSFEQDIKNSDMDLTRSTTNLDTLVFPSNRGGAKTRRRIYTKKSKSRRKQYK
jgi:hypothetical protein